MAVEVELVHALLGEEQGTLGALDLVAQAHLAAGADPARADRADRAIGKAHQELGDVVVLDRAPGRAGIGAGALARAAGRDRPLADEGLAHAADLDDVAEQEAGEGQRVRCHVAERARAREPAIVAPGEREVGIAHHVLIEGAAKHGDLAERAFRMSWRAKRMRRVLQVVEADQRGEAGGLGRLGHRPGLGRGVGERLLAVDRLAGGECGERDLGVHVVRRGDVHDVDARVLDHGAPVRGPAGKAELLGAGLGPLRIDVGDHLELGDRGLGAEHQRHVAIGDGMGLAHPASTDQPNANLHHRSSLPVIALARPPPLAKQAVARACAAGTARAQARIEGGDDGPRRSSLNSSPARSRRSPVARRASARRRRGCSRRVAPPASRSAAATASAASRSHARSRETGCKALYVQADLARHGRLPRLHRQRRAALRSAGRAGQLRRRHRSRPARDHDRGDLGHACSRSTSSRSSS